MQARPELPLKAARALVVLLPVSLIFGPAVSDVILCLITTLFLFQSARARQWQWLRVRWVQCALALGIYITARDLMLGDGGRTALHAAGWLRMPLFAAALGYWVLPHARTEQWLMRGLVATVTFLALDTLWQFFSGFDLFGHPVFMSEGYPRLTGPFSRPRVGLTMLWLLFPALAAIIATPHIRSVWRYAVWAALLVATTLAIYVSGERTPFVMLGVGFVLTFLLTRSLRRPLLLAVLCALLAGWVMAQQSPQLVARQVDATHHTLASYWDTVYGRTWLSATQVAREYPLFGVGSHGFQKECYKPQYGPTDPESLVQRCAFHPHNMYLTWVTDGGLIALGLLCAMVTCWAATALRHWRHWLHLPFATSLVVILAIRLVPLSLAPSQVATWVLVPLWFFAGWLIALLPANRPSQSAT